jgi:hypothetical protein
MHEETQIALREATAHIRNIGPSRQVSLSGETVNGYFDRSESLFSGSLTAGGMENSENMAECPATDIQCQREYADVLFSPLTEPLFSSPSTSPASSPPSSPILSKPRSTSISVTVEEVKPYAPASSLTFIDCDLLDSAIRAGNVERVKRLIHEDQNKHAVSTWPALLRHPIHMRRQDAHIPQVESRKATVLLIATRLKKTAIIRQCLDENANVHLTDKHGATALHNALFGMHEVRIEVLRSLVDCGADVNAADESKQRPIHYCAVYNRSLQAVRTLLDKGARINEPDKDGRTALWLAVSQQNYDLVKLLLEKDATFGRKARPRTKKGLKRKEIDALLDKEEKRRSLTEMGDAAETSSRASMSTWVSCGSGGGRSLSRKNTA